VAKKSGREIVSTGFDEDQLDLRESALQSVDGLEVDRGILANRRVQAAAGFNADDALWRRRPMVHQESGVLGGVDVVGDDGHVDLLAQGLAECQGQGSLAGTDGTADTNAKCLVAHFLRPEETGILGFVAGAGDGQPPGRAARPSAQPSPGSQPTTTGRR
jgi:hypothetical protein